MKNKYLLKKSCYSLLIALGLTTVSCNKNEDSQTITNSDYQLSFEIEGVAGQEGSGDVSNNSGKDVDPSANSASIHQTNVSLRIKAFKSSTMAKALNIEEQDNLLDMKEFHTNDFEVLATAKEESIIAPKNIANISAVSNTAKGNKSYATTTTAATSQTSLVNGTKYGVLIYKINPDNSLTYFTKAEGTSGSTFPAINVDNNVKYKWFAYSYNSTVTLPTPNTTSNPTIPTSTKYDLITSTGEITPSVIGVNKAKILFKHQLAAAAIEFDLRGLFMENLDYNNSASINLAVNNTLQKGTFNFVGNYIDNVSDETVTSIPADQWRQASTTYGDTIIVAGVYSIPATTTNWPTPFKLQIKNFKGKSDGENGGFGSRTATFSGLSTEFALDLGTTPIVKEKGKRLKLTYNILSSLVNAGGKQWSRGNLYRSNNNKGLRFFQNNVGSYTATYTSNANAKANDAIWGEFLNFNTLSPSVNPPSGNSGDPCTRVFPSGRYRLPVKDEFPTNITSYGAVNSGDAVAWAFFDGIAQPSGYDVRYFTFLLQGYRDSNGNFQETPNLSTHVGTGYFWTKSQNANNTKGIALKLSRSPDTQGYVELDKNIGANIKCLKN